MEYIHKITVPSCTKNVTITIARCVKCGSDDMSVSEYEDNHGPPISTVTCKNKHCNHQAKVYALAPDVIRAWNKVNDIDTLIADKLTLIDVTRAEIKGLRVLKRNRQRESK